MSETMTISKYLADWLEDYGTIEIDTNHIPDGADKYGLFKAPTRTTREMNDGSYEITEYFNFFARQSSVTEGDRQDSDQWLEELCYWVDDYPFNYEYPDPGGNRRVTSIAINGTPYPMETDSADTLYQFSITITYTREREEN